MVPKHSMRMSRISPEGSLTWGISPSLWTSRPARQALRAVGQPEPRRAVRVVLDRRHLGRDPALLPPEVDQADLPLVAAPDVPRGDAPVRDRPARPLPGHPRPLPR